MSVSDSVIEKCWKIFNCYMKKCTIKTFVNKVFQFSFRDVAINKAEKMCIMRKYIVDIADIADIVSCACVFV